MTKGLTEAFVHGVSHDTARDATRDGGTMKCRTPHRWIEVENEFLTNKPSDGRPFRGPWTYWLWATSVQQSDRPWPHLGTTRRKYIHTISAPTKRAADAELRRFVKRPNVRVVGKKP